MKVLVLSSTRKERDGIAEYTRQVFRPEFQGREGIRFTVEDITPGTLLRAPFGGFDLIHVQHEFFMFDRWVGVTALPTYLWLWFWSLLRGRALVTTIHSTYNVEALESALPHFKKYRWLFPFGSLYLRFHLWFVSLLSRRILILSKVGLDNMRRVLSTSVMERKVRYTHLGNYRSHIRMQKHGLLGSRFAFGPQQKLFTLFGFAFPNKGYEYAIYALDLLVNQLGHTEACLAVVSGETGKGTFPGGGQGGTYIGWLKRLAAERKLEGRVFFTGYLANEDPLLEDIFAETLCFVFPYLDRNFPSGAISTTLATHKPMLVSDIRCFQEYENLPSFPEKDAAALAAAMRVLLTDPAAVERAAQITQSNADKFGMDRIFQRHAEVYREACPRA